MFSMLLCLRIGREWIMPARRTHGTAPFAENICLNKMQVSNRVLKTFKAIKLKVHNIMVSNIKNAQYQKQLNQHTGWDLTQFHVHFYLIFKFVYFKAYFKVFSILLQHDVSAANHIALVRIRRLREYIYISYRFLKQRYLITSSNKGCRRVVDKALVYGASSCMFKSR